MDSISTQRLSTVYPPLAQKIQQMAAQLEDEGILIRVTQALRTIAEQDALYAQGRTAPGAIVTNCRGGTSWHNYALAADCVPSIGGSIYIPDWDANHPTWKRMIQIGESLNLISGSTWRTFPDAPHFQPAELPVNPTDDDKQWLQEGGLQKVWEMRFPTVTA